MRSESESAGVLVLARGALPGSVMWAWLLALVLAGIIGASTLAASWVPGLGVLPTIAIAAGLVFGALAVVRRLPWPVGLAAGLAVGWMVAAAAAGGLLRADHPSDPQGLALVQVWLGRMQDGSAFGDSAFFVYLACWLMWVAGGWLAWCTLRWRQPLVGLVPGAVVFATNAINFPAQQNGYVLAFVVVALGLMLWSNYHRALAVAAAAQIRLTGDARWDFWESGLVAMAALVVVGLILPPMTTVDRTTTMESGLISQWAALQVRLNHPFAGGGGGVGSEGSTGFSSAVALNGALKRSNEVVFNYSISGTFAGRAYFRGIDETTTSVGQWRPTPNPPVRFLSSEQSPSFAEDYQQDALAVFDVNMILPPAGYRDLLFYPGRLDQVDRDTVAAGAGLIQGPTGSILNIEQLHAANPSSSSGRYSVTSEYSVATVLELEGAGTVYPPWIENFAVLPDFGYRPADVQDRIHALAEKVTAGLTNPYDQATAIETYLRSNYAYTLTPPPIPAGTDPIDYFLFTSKKGYCEFYATAMGDMLRSIGIPVRLVNGYGPGTFDSKQNRYVVKSSDAHTWVEVYFPSFGWIGFEPTNDGVYTQLPRGSQGETVCIREQGCTNPGSTSGDGSTPRPSPTKTDIPDIPGPGVTPTSGGFGLPGPGTLTTILGLVLGAILLLAAATARYLRPRTVAGAWKRAQLLARMAGAPKLTGETPHELGRRLAASFPEASAPMLALTEGFVVAAYAPPEVAQSARAAVLEAWSALRPRLLRRVLRRGR